MVTGDFRHNLEAICASKRDTIDLIKASDHAHSDCCSACHGQHLFAPQQLGAKCRRRSLALSFTLDDGKTYKVPEEFNFEGLKAGVKVLVFYTVVDGNRVVDDLEIVQ
jgi:hypothetical protein